MTPKLREALVDAVEAIEAAGGRYAIVGGLAVGAWAVPRATRDVDLYVDLDREGRTRLAAELEKRGFDVPAMEHELTQFGVFRSRSNHGVFVDIFDSAGPLGEAIIENRREATLAGRSLWFVSATELAALKAFSDRARDFDDLSALLRSSTVNQDAVDRWARQLDESIGTNEVSERVVAARKKS